MDVLKQSKLNVVQVRKIKPGEISDAEKHRASASGEAGNGASSKHREILHLPKRTIQK